MNNKYSVSTNFFEIISGTSNVCSRSYVEAVNDVKDNKVKGLNYLKNFLTSIEFLQKKKKVQDERITKSKGNIKNIVGYKNITFLLDFLNKPMSGNPVLKDLKSIHESLLKYESLYSDGYSKQNGLIMVEYESAAYILMTGLVYIMSTSVEFVQSGDQIVIKTKDSNTLGVITKAIKDLAKELESSSHKKYLSDLLSVVDKEASSDSMSEAVNVGVQEIVAIAFSIGKIFSMIMNAGKKFIYGIKQSLLGIIPIVRLINYLKYKHRVDTIKELEENALFIMQNINKLEKKQGMDPEKKAKIIKKQQAYVDAYMKKAQKLRATFATTEKEAVQEMNKENPKLSSSNSNNGDFVLENGVSIFDIFYSESSNELTRYHESIEEDDEDEYLNADDED